MAINRPEIRLSEDNIRVLDKRLDRMTSEGTEYKGGWNQLHDKYWRMFLAKPESQTKTWPWMNANNFFAPMITTSVMTLAGLYFDAMFGGRPQMIGTDEMDRDVAAQLDRFYFDFVYKKVLSLEHIGDAWNQETLIDGTSVIGMRWSKDRVVVREEEIEQRAITTTDEAEVGGRTIRAETVTGIETDITERAVSVREDRPRVDVLDMARLYVAPGTKRSLDVAGSLNWPSCPWYFVETYVSRETARSMRGRGFQGLEEEDIDALLEEVELTDRERTQAEEEDITQREGRGVFMRKFYMRAVLPGEILVDGKSESQRFDAPDGIPEEIVLWYLPKSRTISRIVPLSRLHPDNKRPHLDNHYSRVGRFFFSMGVPAMLEQPNKLYNSATRQMIDYGTLVNKPWVFYEPATTGLLPAMQEIKPGAMIPVASARGIQTPTFSRDHSFWTVIEQIALQWQERLTSVTDFTIGRAPSVPNAPRTARGQLALLEQGNLQFAHAVALFATPYRELFRRIHSLYQRHAPEQTEFRFFNRESGLIQRQRVGRDAFRADVDFTFQLNPNRRLQMQSAQNRLALVMNIPFLAQDPEALRAAAQEVYAAEGKLDEFNTKIWPQEKIAVQQQQVAAAAAQGGVPLPQTNGNTLANSIQQQGLQTFQAEVPETLSVQEQDENIEVALP